MPRQHLAHTRIHLTAEQIHSADPSHLARTRLVPPRELEATSRQAKSQRWLGQATSHRAMYWDRRWRPLEWPRRVVAMTDLVLVGHQRPPQQHCQQ